MNIQVNGIQRAFSRGSCVQDVLAELGLDRPGVAVAVDGVVVPRAQWSGRALADGAVVEVLTAVQGG